jgi:YD repeat-containing protein
MDQTDVATGATIKSSWTYDAHGNVLSATDPNANTTQITYGCTNLYPATVVTPGALTTAYTFDCTAGSQSSVKDLDNNITTAVTYDNIGRTTIVDQTGSAPGATLHRATTTTYDDANLAVTTAQDVTPTNTVATTTFSDALGRVHSTQDAAGRRVLKLYRPGTAGVSYELTSNPYIGITTTGWTLKTTTLNLTAGTTATFPNVTVTSYDGPTPPAPWGANLSVTGTTSTTGNVLVSGVAGCAGTATQTTDAAGNVRTNCVDGLGRLSAVIEPDSMLTAYTYDAQNNVTSVSAQCLPSRTCSPAGSTGQTRTFTYSLSRLMSATNPESGLVSYTYDNNGNVKSRADANRTNSYLYDALNRLTGTT